MWTELKDISCQGVASRPKILEPRKAKCPPNFLPSQVWPPAKSLRRSWPNASLCLSDWADDFFSVSSVTFTLHALALEAQHPARGTAAHMGALSVRGGPGLEGTMGTGPSGGGSTWSSAGAAASRLRADTMLTHCDCG